VKRMQIESKTAVLSWDSVIHKEARTKDGKPLGYIAAEDEECIYVLSSRSMEYRIPKSRVMEFDGSVLVVDLQFGELGRYMIR
jgi:hypothetical protein